jgi:hypothetical protein
MKKFHSTTIASIFASLALAFHPLPVQASPAAVTFAGLTVSADTGAPNSVVSGSGTFADPWVFSGPGPIDGEFIFSGASVVSCETPVSYPSSDFSRYAFNANDGGCGFQIVTPGSSFGLRVSVQNASQVLYVRKQGSAPSNNNSSNSSQRPSQAAPIKYSGPEFSSLSLKPVLNGSNTTLEGRKLDQISSITIDGKAAKLSDATDKSLKLELPAGLKPGVYDLVVSTANHGKLTHMNAIRIREELPASSLTIKGTGVLSGEEFKKLTAFSRTQNPDMNTVTCIVNSNSEGKSFMQARALCDRIAATNLNIKTTMFETRSTVEGSAIFARVVFSSEE